MLFLCGRRRARSRRGSRLCLYRLLLDALEHRGAAGRAFAGIHGQRDGGDHERHGRPRGGLRQGAGCSPWTECGLAALASKGRGDVAALAALQKHDDDDEETDQDVNGGDEVNHSLWFFLNARRFEGCTRGTNFMVRKGGFEPPRLSAPPPQDGVSASSTTSALATREPGSGSSIITNADRRAAPPQERAELRS